MTSTTAAEVHPFPEESAGKALHKRYESLVAVRAKAVKGNKGAWYWAHLEPILLRHPTSNLPKAVKLKCSLCAAVFSASNPSRTATEHLKRGACSSIAVASPLPLSSLPSLPSLPSPQRKRVSSQIDHFGLSGGRDDLGALAMFESSVKKLKTPKSPSPPSPILSKEQVDSAVELLADWFYESCGSVSLSSLESPKFRAFLRRVGIPPPPRNEFVGPRLDARFESAKADSEARIDDAMFFQIASSGWGAQDSGEGNLVSFTVNLPNRSSVFQKAVFTGGGGPVPPSYAEEVLWTTVEETCGRDNPLQRCVGIVSDKFKSSALRNLETKNQWMVNLPCQLHGITSLIKDFARDFPLFKTVSDNCSKLADLVNSDPHLRRVFSGHLLPRGLAAVEPLLTSSRTLQAAAAAGPVDNSAPARMVLSERFWEELEAVHSLSKTVRTTCDEVAAERPLAGQCLPLWEELRRKVKDWSAKRSPEWSSAAETIVETRLRKIYHPAIAAAFVLDPLNLVRDNTGKYLPPFKCLTQEQEKDVDRLITRLVTKEEAHIALMELMKWRSEGLDPLYAQAVQVKQRDPITGKLKVANPQSSRLVWETCLSEFKTLGKVATRLVFLGATSSTGFKCNWSFMKWVRVHRNSRLGLERAQKMLFVAAQSRLERRESSAEEERDAELFADQHDDILGEVFADASSVFLTMRDNKLPAMKMGFEYRNTNTEDMVELVG